LGAALYFGVSTVEIYEASVSLIVRALVVSARWASRKRRLCLEQAWRKPDRSAKTIPGSIQLRHFPDARITVYGLAT
jgi:hypothetical protein